MRNVDIYPASQTRKILEDKIESASELSSSLSRKTDANSRELKRLSDARQNLMKRVRNELVQESTPDNSIFISYSGVGRELGDMACSIAKEYGLFPKTGFDAEVELRERGFEDIEESLPQSIMAHITSCDCFLGIWTEDFNGESAEGKDMRGNKIERQQGFIPSVWMPFELGVAASHQMPFRLIVISGTHKLYYEKPFQFQSQIIFERHKFEEKCRRVIDYMAKKLRNRKNPI